MTTTGASAAHPHAPEHGGAPQHALAPTARVTHAEVSDMPKNTP